MNSESPTPSWRSLLLILVIGIVIYHNAPKRASVSSPQRITQPGLIVEQAMLKRQLEGRIYWNVADRIKSGEFKTEKQIIDSISGRVPYAEGESRIMLDRELDSLVSYAAVKKALTKLGETASPPTDAEIQEYQLKTWEQLLRERALDE